MCSNWYCYTFPGIVDMSFVVTLSQQYLFGSLLQLGCLVCQEKSISSNTREILLVVHRKLQGAIKIHVEHHYIY